jgi:localization factor PodJL
LPRPATTIAPRLRRATARPCTISPSSTPKASKARPTTAAAAEWFRKGADRGVADSQYNLGILYARGIGVEHNFAEAYKWFSLAAKEGDKDAAKKRDDIAAHLDQQSLAAARSAIEQWTPLPQPADEAPKGAWDAPASPAPTAKSKPRNAKASVPEAAKLN